MRITLCENAENHPDGTYSLRRAGLSHWSVDEAVRFVVFIEATPAEIPPGPQHAFTLTGVGAGGEFALAGYVGSPPGASIVNIAMPPVELQAKEAGTIVVTLKIGNHEASTSITIKPSTIS